MASFDRFDICEAYMQLEYDYNVGGWLRERPSNRRRMESTGVQLARLQFRPAMGFDGYESLTDNGKEIYLENMLKYKLPLDDEQRERVLEFFVPEWLREHYPHIYKEGR